ncbi:MAG: STAS domain-containing protein [Chthoniobacteraceae bacterium]|jgi:anti-sigma B factor antagonist
MTISDTLPVVSEPEPSIISLEGEIDLHESPNVRESLRPYIERKAPRVFVDMTEVSYVDSSGLAVLIDAMQRIANYGGKFGIIGIRPAVRNVLEIARLDQVFRLYPDRASAVSAV